MGAWPNLKQISCYFTKHLESNICLIEKEARFLHFAVDFILVAFVA